MPTFLVNSKMNPALRARVQRSLGGRSSAARLPARFIAVLRFASVGLLVIAVVGIFGVQRERAQELEAAKQKLLQRLDTEAKGLSPDDHLTVPRALDWLKRISEGVPTEFLQQGLGNADSAGKLLARRIAFVRADTKEVTTDGAREHAVAKTSRDGVARCLLDPPVSAKETDLLAHLRLTPEDSWSMASSVELLGAAMAGLPLFEPRWASQVKDADSIDQLGPLGDVIEHAPLVEAKRAAKVELALFVLDEPKEADVPVEIDGTHRHVVRVHLVDLRAEQELLRTRRVVDPAWISEAKRQRHAKGLVDCRLGFELRQLLFGQKLEDPSLDAKASK